MRKLVLFYVVCFTLIACSQKQPDPNDRKTQTARGGCPTPAPAVLQNEQFLGINLAAIKNILSAGYSEKQTYVRIREEIPGSLQAFEVVHYRLCQDPHLDTSTYQRFLEQVLPRAQHDETLSKEPQQLTQNITIQGTSGQVSTGDHSPNIQTKDGDVYNFPNNTGTVNIKGVPQSVVDRLLKNLEEKDIALEKRDQIIEEWVKKYKELEERLAQRSDTEELIKQAKDALRQGNLDEAERLLLQSLNLRVKKIEEERLLAALDAYELGSINELKIEYQAARKYYEQAVNFDPDNSLYLNQYAIILATLSQYKQAIEYFEKALLIDLPNHGEQHSSVARVWGNLGLAWRNLGHYQKAIEYHEKSLASDLRNFGQNHPNVARTWNNLGIAWIQLGKYQKAIEYLEKALKSEIQNFGENHPTVARIWNNLGEAWRHLGEYQKAIAYFEKALKSKIQNFGENHPTVAGTWNNLGLAWSDLGDYQKAIEYLERALKSEIQNFGETHPTVATTWNNLGLAWIGLGDYQEAIEYLEKALASDLRNFGQNHPNVAIDWTNLGNAWRDLGDYQEAIEYYEKALVVFQKSLGDDHPQTKLVQENLSKAVILLEGKP